jgi:ribokinase
MSAASLRSAHLGGLLVFGDINVDILARVDGFTGLGGDYLVPELEQHCGGVGANTALALVKWGVPVRLLGCVGRDWLGEFALQFLTGAGIDVSFVQQTERAMTGLMFIPISAGGERTMFGSRGANAVFREPDANQSCLEGVEGLHLVGYNFLSPGVAEGCARLIAEARGRGVWISLDVGMAPSRQIPQVILDAARRVDVLFVGLEEAAALTGKADRAEILGALEKCGAGEIVVKLGEKGCLFRENNKWLEVPPISVAAVDTTGAGDAFAAAFLRARLRRWPAAEAALVANAAGAAAAAVLGAGEGMPGPKAALDLLAGSRLPNSWEPARMQSLKCLREELNLPAEAGTSGGQHGTHA